MVPDGHAVLQGLTSIPHWASVAAGFYRSDVPNGCETSKGRARAMMDKFAITTASLIDSVGRRAIGIALRPQHFKGGVLGMNRCHGRSHRATRRGPSVPRSSPIMVVPANLARADKKL